jgi:hypothetical protein
MITKDLPPDAEKLLHVMIEEFRKLISPDDEPEQFRRAALELMNAGLVKIYQEGDNYSLRPTPEGLAAGAMMQ